MKRFNNNFILFVCAFVFVLFGFGASFRWMIVDTLYIAYSNIKTGNIIGGISDCVSYVSDTASKSLSYHDTLMDIDSAKNNLLNTAIIIKDDSTIAKTESGTLTEVFPYVPDETIETAVSNIEALYATAIKNDADFLYVGVAQKSYGLELPSNVSDYSKVNYDRFINSLSNKNIPTLNLTDELNKSGKWSEDLFFITDHHWKPNVGFWATEKICSTLSVNYGFVYDDYYTNPENYETTTYENWFLGSYGKKTGRFFVNGAEDIDIILPKFDTKFTSAQPFKNETKQGTFYEVLMESDFIETKDPYHLNAYATYTGGDFQYQIVKNELNPNGKKILVLRDSFACVVTPYLAMNTSELHIFDMRDFTKVSEDRIDVHEYIEKEKPDYVILLYSGMLNDISKCSF